MNTNTNSTMLDTIRRAAHGCRACPFCGVDPLLPSEVKGWDWDTERRELVTVPRYIVGCENEDCAARPSVTGDSVKEAWAKWNGRTG